MFGAQRKYEGFGFPPSHCVALPKGAEVQVLQPATPGEADSDAEGQDTMTIVHPDGSSTVLEIQTPPAVPATQVEGEVSNG